MQNGGSKTLFRHSDRLLVLNNMLPSELDEQSAQISVFINMPSDRSVDLSEGDRG